MALDGESYAEDVLHMFRWIKGCDLGPVTGAV
jgi:hypothetical protein